MANYFDEIKRNNLKSALLMFFFTLLFAGIVFILTLFFGLGPGGIITILALVLVIALIYAFISYRHGDKIVLKLSHAVPADRKQYPQLYNVVEGLALATQIPVPAVYIINDPNPNAFACGRRKSPSIAVTTGLLSIMDKNELQGVIAHEISHVADNDILYMTIAVVYGGLIGLVAGYLRLTVFLGGIPRGGGRNNGGGIIILVALVIGILAPIIAMLLRLAISRRREYMADTNGARITRAPKYLANALRKIEAYTKAPGAKGVKTASEVTATLYFSSPLSAKSLGNLFSTHPPIEDRIARLEKMY